MIKDKIKNPEAGCKGNAQKLLYQWLGPLISMEWLFPTFPPVPSWYWPCPANLKHLCTSTNFKPAQKETSLNFVAFCFGCAKILGTGEEVVHGLCIGWSSLNPLSEVDERRDEFVGRDCGDPQACSSHISMTQQSNQLGCYTLKSLKVDQLNYTPQEKPWDLYPSTSQIFQAKRLPSQQVCVALRVNRYISTNDTK